MSEAQQAGSAPVQNAESSEVMEGQQPEQSLEAGASQEGAVQDLQEKAVSGSPKEKAEAKAILSKLKLKVDGKEYEEELPFSIEDNQAAKDYLTKNLQLSKAAQKRMQEYSQLEKEVRSFVEELKKNPKRVLSDPSVGIDIKKMAAEILEEEISNSQKSPEQLKLEKAEAELRSLKEQREKEQKELQEKENERLMEQEMINLDNWMSDAFEASDTPKNPFLIKRAASLLHSAVSAENIPLTQDTVKAAVKLAKEEMHSELREMFSLMGEDVVENIIGKDTINKIRKKNISKAKEKPPIPLQSGIKDVSKVEIKPSNNEIKRTIKDFLKV